MIASGLEEPVIDPRTWVEMEGFEAPCDRCLLVFWGRPFDIAKSVLEDVEEETKLKIPALRGARGMLRYVFTGCISVLQQLR